MIRFDPATRTFNLFTATSIYAFRVDNEGRLLHLAWGTLPVGAPEGATLRGPGFESLARADELPLTRRYELSTFCDSAQQEVSLKVSFSALPAGLAPDEAPYLPVRDVRLRYLSHKIVTDPSTGSGCDRRCRRRNRIQSRFRWDRSQPHTASETNMKRR